MAKTNFLTREQVDGIVEAMTARDIFAGLPEGNIDQTKVKGSDVAAKVFEAAAERQGHGASALDRVKPQDTNHLIEILGEALNATGPKAEGGAS